MITFADVLSRERERAELTRYRLALLSGTNLAALGRIESGERAPSLETAMKLLRALSCALELAEQPALDLGVLGEISPAAAGE